MKQIENPILFALNIKCFKEMGEDAFRKWCNSTISVTKNEYETEILIAAIKENIKKEAK